jgi:hypothetical protein
MDKHSFANLFSRLFLLFIGHRVAAKAYRFCQTALYNMQVAGIQRFQALGLWQIDMRQNMFNCCRTRLF